MVKYMRKGKKMFKKISAMALAIMLPGNAFAMPDYDEYDTFEWAAYSGGIISVGYELGCEVYYEKKRCKYLYIMPVCIQALHCVAVETM